MHCVHYQGKVLGCAWPALARFFYHKIPHKSRRPGTRLARITRAADLQLSKGTLQASSLPLILARPSGCSSAERGVTPCRPTKGRFYFGAFL